MKGRTEMSKVWLITGSARGLGRSITEAALSSGATVLATARNPDLLAELKTKYSSASFRTFPLDVTDAKAAHTAVEFAVSEFGRLDVLVNNAGYGHIVPFEQMTAIDFRDQIETNFYGAVNLVRAALPKMRVQRSGHVINVSSVGGRVSSPGLSAYQAAKWALGGFTEVLAKEAAAFGVNFVALEPGGMRTDWSLIAAGLEYSLMQEYETSVGERLKTGKANAGAEIGDPARVAAVVVELVKRDVLPSHLLLGSDALRALRKADAIRQNDANDWESVSVSTDFPTVELPS
jgi:NAD(P)-dependent dehydrogenase (short-subunit alcohol dehydrogenase family)